MESMDFEDADRIFREKNPSFYNRYIQIDGSREFFDALARPLRTSIRINTLKADLDEIVERISNDYHLERIRWCREGFFIDTKNFGSMVEHRLGLVFPQEAVSMIPPVLMEIEPKQKILDLCSAPGAKATQIAQYMENEGCLVANDLNPKRLNILISNLQRCGVLVARVTKMDGRRFSRYEERFDRVLVDAPCSNVGMIRKNFKYLKYWREREIERLSRLQKDLILAGYKALKPGGILIYSTCTLDPVENEEVVDHLIRSTDAEMEDIDIPINRRKPFDGFGDKEYTSEVKKCLRIHPQDNDTEAFFVAKIRKP